MNIKQIIGHTCRTLVGLVFTFSGFVKIIDPLGTQYKIEDYLHAMGPFMTQLDVLAFPAAMCLVTLEFVIGICLLLNVFSSGKSWKQHWMLYLPTLMMVFMTPLTLWIAIADPVEDCGCFGDALVISNWATFWKNIVLDLLLVGCFVTCSSIESWLKPKVAWGCMGGTLIVSLSISAYCLLHLPIIDFRPYKVGINIQDGMEIPEGAPTDSSVVTLIYKERATGNEQEFTIENYPKDTTKWAFIDSKTEVIRKGYVPPIHDFVISNEDYEELTYDILENEGETVLVIMYKIEDANQKQVDRLNKLYQEAIAQGRQFYAVTGSGTQEVEDFKAKNNPEYEICSCDGVTLKTIVRANPGLIVIKDGIITEKYNLRDYK